MPSDEMEKGELYTNDCEEIRPGDLAPGVLTPITAIVVQFTACCNHCEWWDICSARILVVEGAASISCRGCENYLGTLALDVISPHTVYVSQCYDVINKHISKQTETIEIIASKPIFEED